MPANASATLGVPSSQPPSDAKPDADSSGIEDLEACPSGVAEPSDDSPSWIADDLGSFYDAMLVDYLEGAGDQVVQISPSQRRRAVCAALGKEGLEVFARAQSGKLQLQTPETCVGKDKQSLYMGRIIWELSKLPNGKFLATRTARAGSPWGLMYRGHGIETSLDGPFVITLVSSSAWLCPLDRSDPCDLYGDEKHPEEPGQVRCAFDGTTACSEAGMTSAVYVTDYRTRATAYFGDFFRRPKPSVAIEAAGIVVTAGECVQTASLPLVAAVGR